MLPQVKLIWGFAFSLLFNRTYCSVYTYNWLNIDCGAEASYTDSNDVPWVTDKDYIKTGQNKPVGNRGLAVSDQLGTLRFFKELSKNCYQLPAPTKVKYIIRAGFYYGNYDGQMQPPSFDLVFDGNKWATVITSIDEPVLYEMVYAAAGDYITICVARTQPGQIPFISSLELMPLTQKMYDRMNRNYAWFLSYRVHFGGNNDIGYPADNYNRLWKPFPTPGLAAVVANFTELSGDCTDDLPLPVILHAVEAADASSSISLPFDFPETNRTNYISLYFTEVIQLSPDQSRSLSILIDGQDYGLLATPQYQFCDEVNVTTKPAVGTMNISISSISGSTLPPLICAAEVFTVSSTLAGSTSQTDMDGLQILIQSFTELLGWTGDPCLPNNTVWEWLSCNRDDPPRVTALYLTGYGLEGSIPNFVQMQALEIIYMDNNHLNGGIPDFLGQLPNLRILNLAYNNLDKYDVPLSLSSNHNLLVNLTGNPTETPENSDAKNSLWSLLSLGLIGYVVWYCWCREGSSSETHIVATGIPVEPARVQTNRHVEITHVETTYVEGRTL